MNLEQKKLKDSVLHLRAELAKAMKRIEILEEEKEVANMQSAFYQKLLVQEVYPTENVEHIRSIPKKEAKYLLPSRFAVACERKKENENRFPNGAELDFSSNSFAGKDIAMAEYVESNIFEEENSGRAGRQRGQNFFPSGSCMFAPEIFIPEPIGQIGRAIDLSSPCRGSGSL